MTKILTVLAIAGLSWFSTNAQTGKPIMSCPAPKGKVCHRSANGISCYKTPYAEDYKICKNENGYFVCCEVPGITNATHPRLANAGQFEGGGEDMQGLNEAIVLQSLTSDEFEGYYAASTVPQSQSYVPYSDMVCATPGACHARKAKSCYGGNNVAELNRAAYNGCPTPAYDGPDANKARNVNVSNYTDIMPPIGGRPQ
jgi:hypothetical protein